jgi:MATE family multidrug resistance protein
MSNLAALAYMMPMSIGVTTAALSAQSLGAKAFAHAHRTSMVGLGICLAGAILTALLLFFERQTIVGIYTDKAEVAAVAFTLLAILPWFHIIDSMQCINSYILRAHKIAIVPMLLQIFALLCVGLMGGWWFGFGSGSAYLAPVIRELLPGAPLGATSMWLMAALGLAISASLLQGFYRYIVRRDDGLHI